MYTLTFTDCNDTINVIEKRLYMTKEDGEVLGNAGY